MTTELIQLTNQPKTAVVSTVTGVGPIAESGTSELSGLIAEEAGPNPAVSGPDIDRLVALRAAFREHKQYALADEVRGWLDSQGVSVEDSASGSIWEYRRTS